ncbi:2-keto-4-pentenoate hydratase [Stutzerimonas nitrititolerans]|uniref:2-keto-4-pentenoate hydratase n=1 Tax=Stutzerimonas nitrititolerans TaxID=2482751 RepID=UPI0028973D75|nr:fumarylacetoacetate hydrolase family protein [Stutzerimonas nitrititolerans]
MSKAHIDAVARRLITGWRTGQRQPLSGLALPDTAAAYAVQRRVGDALGWFDGARPAAWKLGGSPGGMVSAAAVQATAIHRSGWHVPPGYVTALGIEGELVIRLGRNLTDTADLTEIRSAIDAWLPAIELCDTRLEGGINANPLLRLADQQLNRALILGNAVQLHDLPVWLKQTAILRVDGHEVVNASGSHPYIDPLSSLPWLARHAVAQGTPLRAGDLIATGSWTGIYWANPGQKITFSLNSVGEVMLNV